MAEPPSITAEVLDSTCATEIGESPIWSSATQEILWVDIRGKRFYRRAFGAEGAATAAFDLPERPGCFCLCADGRTIFAFEKGLAYYDAARGPASLERIAAFEPDMPLAPDSDGVPRGTRMNDGRVDPQGRLVVGGYDGAGQGRSAIYRLDPLTMHVETLLTRVQCANAICFSADGGCMYFTDSARAPKGVYRCAGYGVGAPLDFHDPVSLLPPTAACTGAIADGSVVDAEGHLWSAQFGLGRVVRLDAAGAVDFVIHVAAPFPTCMAFGGPDLRHVFITACAAKCDAAQLAALPAGVAGALFVARLPDGIAGGRPESLFGARDAACTY
jgi:L-arabinonolactonase